MKKFSWRQDPDAEKVIRDFANIDFIVEEIPFSEIDWRESANNCARLENPLNAEKIEEYASAFQNGDVFPMPVMERSEKGYIILGGNQRCNALKSLAIDGLVVSAYIVDPLTSANRELIIRSLNSRHGWGSSKQERFEHAVFLVEAKGILASVAARAMMVGESQIKLRLRANKCRQDLLLNGIRDAADQKKFSPAMLDVIARVTDAARIKQLAAVIADTSPTVDAVSQLVKGVLNAKSQASAQKLVAEAAKEWAIYGSTMKDSKKSNNKHREIWLRKTGDMEKFLETGNQGAAFSSFDELGLTPADADKAMVVIAKLMARFNCLLDCERVKRS